MNNQAAQTMPELPKAWGFARNVDGQIEIRIGPVCPPNRSGGLATPWAPMFGGDQMHQYARDYASLSKTAGVVVGVPSDAVAWAVYGFSDEYGSVLLPDYIGTMDVIRNRVMEVARREGYDGHFVQRMAELGWYLEPLFRATNFPETSSKLVVDPGRYFADGPQGHFFADDLQLARDLVNLYDKNDDWTITDLRNPTGAAPAASGGEDGLVAGIMAHFCNAIDNLNDMPVSDEWARKWTAKAEFLIGMGPDPGDQSLSDTPNQTPAAPVSERAREAWEDFVGCHLGDDEGEASLQTSGLCRMAFDAGMRASSEPSIEDAIVALVSALQRGKGWMRDYADAIVRDAIDRRGLDEQALTQQRGEIVAWIGPRGDLIDNARFQARVSGLPDFGDLSEYRPLYTTPQPSADAVRELVAGWRHIAGPDRNTHVGTEASKTFSQVLKQCADELESLLSGGSHA